MDEFVLLARRLRAAQNTLEQHLGTAVLMRASEDPRRLAVQLRGAQGFVDARVVDVAENEVARLELIAKHVAELAERRPDVVHVLRRKLLSRDVGDYYGGRYEAAVATALTRRGVLYEYDLSGAPDFTVDVDGKAVGIESTSARLDALESADPFFKVELALKGKARKPYASRLVAVVIDVTILFARSLRAGGDLFGDDLEARLEQALHSTDLGAVIVTAHVFDDRVRPRRMIAPYRRVDHLHSDPALRKLLDHAFPRGSERIPLVWVSHLT